VVLRQLFGCSFFKAIPVEGPGIRGVGGGCGSTSPEFGLGKGNLSWLRLGAHRGLPYGLTTVVENSRQPFLPFVSRSFPPG